MDPQRQPEKLLKGLHLRQDGPDPSRVCAPVPELDREAQLLQRIDRRLVARARIRHCLERGIVPGTAAELAGRVL